MRIIDDPAEFQRLRARGAVLVLYGGAGCAVCHSLRPRLQALIGSRYPEILQVYVDCEAAPALCAQSSVFSVPLVQVWFEGALFVEAGRAFSLSSLAERIDKPYRQWRSALAD